MTELMYFVGVTTGASAILRLFPRWAEVMGLDAAVVGRDVPLGAAPAQYRAVVEEIAHRPLVRGALITTHKVAMHDHAADLLGRLDEWAQLCGEVSCIAKRAGGLVGSAKDPVTVGWALADLVGASYFSEHPEAEVVCLGAGGSGTALTTRLLAEPPFPARIVVSDVAGGRLQRLAEVHRRLGTGSEVEYRKVVSSDDSDRLVEAAARWSIVVNATGMGKDLPGSPLGDPARFPEDGVVWDFNYRGDLEFLDQARRQQKTRRLRLHDGWRYFLYGWSDHIAEVFEIEMTPPLFDKLAGLAELLRRRRNP